MKYLLVLTNQGALLQIAFISNFTKTSNKIVIKVALCPDEVIYPTRTYLPTYLPTAGETAYETSRQARHLSALQYIIVSTSTINTSITWNVDEGTFKRWRLCVLCMSMFLAESEG